MIHPTGYVRCSSSASVFRREVSRPVHRGRQNHLPEQQMDFRALVAAAVVTWREAFDRRRIVPAIWKRLSVQRRPRWGTLVTRFRANNSWSDSNPSNLSQPGDVIQFGSAIFATRCPERFTSVVAQVDGGGRPTAVYQQNFAGNRTVKQATIDTTMLTSGWLRIYRPFQRIDRFNEWKFTVVNNSTSSQSYQMMNGVVVDSSVTLNSANMPGSYRVHQVQTIGTVPNYFLQSNESSFFVETAKGNEIYSSSNGLSFVSSIIGMVTLLGNAQNSINLNVTEGLSTFRSFVALAHASCYSSAIRRTSSYA